MLYELELNPIPNSNSEVGDQNQCNHKATGQSSTQFQSEGTHVKRILFFLKEKHTYFGDNLRIFWDYFGDILGHFWDILGIIWGYFGNILRIF